MFCRFVLLLAIVLAPCSSQEVPPPDTSVGWHTMDEILARTVPPTFPERSFAVADFGAVNDGATDCSDAFAKAIEACASAGGGRVVVPAGAYLTGPIHLRSNVNFVVERGATIRFSTDPARYLPAVYTRWEGVECMNYSPLIYAYRQENIAVTGEGVLDGQGSRDAWWPWKGGRDWSRNGVRNQEEGRKRLFEMAERAVPVAERRVGEGAHLRPSFFQPYESRNVHVSGVTFRDSPMWFLNPVLCTNVVIDGVTVEGLGPNNDGCDPESCRDVLIQNCQFNTGDDCIAIKSGRNADGRRVNVPSENVVIRKSRMKNGHGGVVVGSEISGGVRNVFVEDCEMDSPHLDRALRFKTNSVRGGIVENFFARRITVGQVAEAVVKVDFTYEEGDAGAFTPVVRRIRLSDITCEKGQSAFWMKGYERSPVSDVVVENSDFNGISSASVFEHTSGVVFRNVKINGIAVAPPTGAR